MHNLGEGFWLAIGTLTVLGYGDIIPITWGGRIVSSILMFSGIIILYGTLIALLERYVLERWLYEKGIHEVLVKVGRDKELEGALEELKNLSKLKPKRLKELEKKFDKIFEKKIHKKLH